MNWEALGAIAELVGSVAVVFTLAYLAVETRRNAIAIRSASANQMRDALTGVMSLIAGDDETAAFYYESLLKPERVTGHRRVRLDALLTLQLRATEVMFLEYRAGLISEELWYAHWRGQRVMLYSPGGRAWWLRSSQLVTEEFRVWLEADLEADWAEAAKRISAD